MPELPEIETIRRALAENLPGKQVERVLVRDARLRWPVDETRLRQLLVSETVTEIDRRSKYLLIKFARESVLMIHLGMSGRLLLLTEAAEFDKHDHVIFYFTDGAELRFRDPRRFGLVDAVAPGQLRTHPRLLNLGVEPLAESTTAALLRERSGHWQRPIKSVLMDANFIAGVGNIYANEALFHAGIHPATPCSHLSQEDWRNLLHCVRCVLENAIAAGGTTLNDFVNSNGETGYFQLSLAVYGREGELCEKCGAMIERIVQVGRSTFYCPACQVGFLIHE